MTNLSGALAELRAERSKAQQELGKLDEAISMLENLNGAGRSGRAGSRHVSAAARRKMALAQKARWAKFHQERAAGNSSIPRRKPLSIAARRKIAAAQRARWARQKQAA